MPKIFKELLKIGMYTFIFYGIIMVGNEYPIFSIALILGFFAGMLNEIIQRLLPKDETHS